MEGGEEAQAGTIYSATPSRCCGGPQGCGQSFYARAYGRSVATYRCRGRDGYNGPPTDCDTPALPQPLVDNAVRKVVARLENPRATERDIEATVKDRAAQARKDAKAAVGEVAKVERRLDSARVKFLDDASSRSEYEQLRVELEVDLTAALTRQAEAEALARDLATNGHDHAEAIRAARELARNEAPSPAERDRYRAFLETHFDRFTVAVVPVLGPPPPDDAARRSGSSGGWPRTNARHSRAHSPRASSSVPGGPGGAVWSRAC
jgi:hypothetical protein